MIIAKERIDDLAAIDFDKDVELLDGPKKLSSNDSTTIKASSGEKLNGMVSAAPVSKLHPTGRGEGVKDGTVNKNDTEEVPTLKNAHNPRLDEGKASHDTQPGDCSRVEETTKEEVAHNKPENGQEEINSVPV